MIFKKLAALPAFTAKDLTSIKEVLHPKNDDVALDYSLAHATVAVGASSIPHRLLERSEVYFILSGTGVAHIDGKSVTMVVGDTLFIPAGATQYIENTGTSVLEFLCIVSPAWSEEADVAV